MQAGVVGNDEWGLLSGSEGFGGWGSIINLCQTHRV